jgi:Tol biopolymer transport system component/DNA-binding winged helix-turn-helix (wHTH) protein
MPTVKQPAKLAFGLYEVDLQTGELWRAGHRIKLQGQPFKVLSILLERHGEIITREELQLRLWGNDTTVNFEHSLATAINKIREALRDSAENPRFVETLARRGYRFIAPVSRIDEAELVDSTSSPENAGANIVHVAASHSQPETMGLPDPLDGPRQTVDAIQPVAPVDSHVNRRRTWFYPVLLLGAFAVATIWLGYWFGSRNATTVPPQIRQLTGNGHLAFSVGVMETFTASVTDGYRLFVPTVEEGRASISTIPTAGGSLVSFNIPDAVAGPELGDISPDGSKLLLRNHLSPESEQALWVVPTGGGSALRVGAVLAHDATWMPDGIGVLYAAGNDLYLAHGTDGSSEHYASLPGRAFWLRWNPSGKLLRFTVVDPIAHTQSLWQLSDSERKPKQLLKGFSSPSTECCGVWTSDGKSFVFQAGAGGNTDLWKLSSDATTNPVRLTNGPLQFQSPAAARGGNTVYFLGVDVRSEVERVTATGELVQEKGFLASADRVVFSQDHRWVAWTDNNGRLWRAAPDGSQKLQLTPDSMNVFMAHWSPDGSRLALMAREPGKAWQLYLVAAGGGDIQPLLKETRNAADPSWSPDGQSLVFGRVNDELGKENTSRTLRILHIQSGQVDEVPGSEGLFSPRWSPDGRYIAALSLDQRQVRLFNVASRTWNTLPVESGADPVWSSDSRSLYIHCSLDPSQPIDRISIPDGKVYELVRLAGSSESNAVDYIFIGLNQENLPLIRARTSTGNLYSMQVR